MRSLLLLSLLLAACTKPAPAKAPPPPLVDTLGARVIDSVSHHFVVTRKIPARLMLESDGYFCQMHYQAQWDSVQVGDTLTCAVVPGD